MRLFYFMIIIYDKEFENFKYFYWSKFPDSDLKLVGFAYFKEIKYIVIESIYGLCKVKATYLLKGVIPTIKSAIDPVSYYQNIFNEKFPLSKYKVITIENSKVIVETEFGLCKINKYKFLKGGNVNIAHAINKLEYFKNKFYKKYPNSNINILNYNNGIIEFIFNNTTYYKKHSLLLYNGFILFPLKEQFLNTCKKFTEKASKIHNNKYDYSLVQFKKSKDKIEIICPVHNSFWQTTGNHLNGQGCRKCQYDKLSEYNHENNFRLSIWKKKGLKSKLFDSFKIYILRCWNEEEEFYKIGRTFLTVKRRFQSIKKMPYNYEIIQEIIETAEEVYKLEIELKKQNKKFKYKPKIKFHGVHESFKKGDLEAIVREYQDFNK